MEYLRVVLPVGKVIAIPNGARRTASGRAANGVPGLTPGVPDLCVILPDGKVLWLEVKAPKGIVSDAQLQFHFALQVLKHDCAVVRSVDDVKLALKTLNIKTRETA